MYRLLSGGMAAAALSAALLIGPANAAPVGLTPSPATAPGLVNQVRGFGGGNFGGGGHFGGGHFGGGHMGGGHIGVGHFHGYGGIGRVSRFGGFGGGHHHHHHGHFYGIPAWGYYDDSYYYNDDGECYWSRRYQARICPDYDD